MKPASLLLASIPFLASCQQGALESATNDEVTTTLQILADNIQKLPSQEDQKTAGRSSGTSSRPIAAGRFVGPICSPEDSGKWVPSGWIHDWANYSVWAFSRIDPSAPANDIPGGWVETSTEIRNGIDGMLTTRESETFANDRFRHGSFQLERTNRTGFRFRLGMSYSLDSATGEWLRYPETLQVPQLGVQAIIPADSADSILASGVPVLRSGVQIGTLRMDGWMTLRWFDLTGKEYHGTDRETGRFGPDSIRMHLSSIDRDTVDGGPGWRLKGWYYFPDSLDLAIDTVYPIVEPTAWWSGSYLRYQFEFKRSAVLPGNRFDHFLTLAEIRSGFPSTPPEYGEEHLYLAAKPYIRRKSSESKRVRILPLAYTDSLPLRYR